MNYDKMKIGNKLVVKSQEELKEVGVDENSPVFFLCGKNFPITHTTIEAVRTGMDFIAKLVVDQRVRNILSKDGYVGAEELKDNSLINIKLEHVKKFVEENEMEDSKSVIKVDRVYGAEVPAKEVIGVNGLGGIFEKILKASEEVSVKEVEPKELVDERPYTKYDLQFGMLVKLRNRSLRLIMPSKDGMILINGLMAENISVYTDDLRCVADDGIPAPVFDIVEIYGISNEPELVLAYDTLPRTLLWKRKDVREFSKEEAIAELAKVFNLPIDEINIV